MAPYICKYIKDCPIYQEKVATDKIPLVLYKNVFCKRGVKGWNNCEHFLEYEKQESLKKPIS